LIPRKKAGLTQRKWLGRLLMMKKNNL
jgi:hypothetical protein